MTFGANTYGQLGHGVRVDQPLPMQVSELAGDFVTRVACGRYNTKPLSYL